MAGIELVAPGWRPTLHRLPMPDALPMPAVPLTRISLRVCRSAEEA